MQQKGKRIHVAFGDDDAYLRQKAKELGVSPSAYLRRLIRGRRLAEEKGAPSFQTDLAEKVSGPTTSIIFRFQETEKAALIAFAKQKRLSRQQAAILLIRSGLTGEPFISGKDAADLSRVAYEINKVGVNINQLAHVYNELWKAGRPGDIDPKKLQRAVREGLKAVKEPVKQLRNFLALKNRKHPLVMREK